MSEFLALEKFVLIIKFDNEEVGILNDAKSKKSQELYASYSEKMVRLYNKMADMANKNVIPMLVKRITEENPPEPDGLIKMLGDKPNQPCWCLYDNGTFKNDPSIWTLFLPDGKLAVSRGKDDGVWSYDDNSGFAYHDCTDHHAIFCAARAFDGLMEICYKCHFNNRVALSLWKDRFDLLYAQYCQTRDLMLFKKGIWYQMVENE